MFEYLKDIKEDGVSFIESIVIFGGTTEGRRLVEELAHLNLKLYVCVATEYGASLIPQSDNVSVNCGRMDIRQMEEYLEHTGAGLCIDATHPYAVLVSENISRACAALKLQCIRVVRDCREENTDYYVETDSISEAVEFLKGVGGNIFITTGSKELQAFTALPDYKERCTARVLPTADAINKCADIGFEGRNLICMQGPFSEEMNYQMFSSAGASWVVTKNSGKEGGYQDKCEAAIRAGAGLVVVGRPVEHSENAMNYRDAVNFVVDIVGQCDEDGGKFADTIGKSNEPHTIYVIGIGPGAESELTFAARKAISCCDVIIGAERCLETCEGIYSGDRLSTYKTDEIVNFINENKQYDSVGVVYSGDIGFYSGAKKLIEYFEQEEFWYKCDDVVYSRLKNGELYQLSFVPGLSSVAYMIDCMGLSWEEVVFASNHGREGGIEKLVSRNRQVCTLLGKPDDVADICRRLVDCGMNDVFVTVGERLSYEDEALTMGNAEDMLNSEFDSLSVALFENNNPISDNISPKLRDDDFIRGNVPMTKEEIRVLSLAKLRLNSDSVLYDVGAGTGSVAVEAARIMPKGRVYAIEKNAEGMELIKSNCRKHCAINVNFIEGYAPDVFCELERPTHAFIGGSDGRLSEIVGTLLEKNENIRCVINAITIETVAELEKLCKLYPQCEDMEIIQVGVSRGRKAGAYHLMTAENPVYIASFGGE